MNSYKISYIFLAAITLVLLLAILPLRSGFTSHNSVLDKIQQRGQLRIGTLPSPITYFESKDEKKGFDYELAKRFADYLNVELVVLARDNVNELFDDLQNERVDLLAAGLIYNPSRLQHAHAGPTYYHVKQQLIYRVGNRQPKTLYDANGDIHVAAGSANAALIELMQPQYSNLNVVYDKELSSQGILEKLAFGEINYAVADSTLVSLMQHIFPQLAVAFDLTEEIPVTWYIKRTDDDSMYAAMLDFFSQSNDDNTLSRLEEGYIGHIGKFDYLDTRVFLNAIDETLPKYRPMFEKYAKKAGVDWKLLAAMAYQESHWDPKATSPTGVRGMMMLTNGTARLMGIKNRVDAEESIRGGAQYIKQLIDKMPESIAKNERVWYALTAYNMGLGHTLDLRKLTEMQKGNPNSWADVKRRLPLLSDKRYYKQLHFGHARGYEAYNYVENIRRYMVSLSGYLHDKGLDKPMTTAEDAPIETAENVQ